MLVQFNWKKISYEFERPVGTVKEKDLFHLLVTFGKPFGTIISRVKFLYGWLICKIMCATDEWAWIGHLKTFVCFLKLTFLWWRLLFRQKDNKRQVICEMENETHKVTAAVIWHILFFAKKVNLDEAMLTATRRYNAAPMLVFNSLQYQVKASNKETCS